jgi:hypothetical protein
MYRTLDAEDQAAFCGTHATHFHRISSGGLALLYVLYDATDANAVAGKGGYGFGHISDGLSGRVSVSGLQVEQKWAASETRDKRKKSE